MCTIIILLHCSFFIVLVADVLIYIPAVFVFSFLCLGRKPALNKVMDIYNNT